MNNKRILHPHTVVINQLQKQKAKQLRQEALNWLATRFPEAFDNRVRIRPLKIGIIQDLLQYAEEAEQAGISKAKLREAVNIFTRRLDYLICLKAREMRIDLEGKPVAEVNKEDAEKAASKLKKRLEKTTMQAVKKASETSCPSEEKSFDYPLNAKSKSRTYMGQDNIYKTDRYPMQPHHQAYVDKYIEVKPKSTPAIIIKPKASKLSYAPIALLKEKLTLSKK